MRELPPKTHRLARDNHHVKQFPRLPTARCPSASTVAILREAPTGFEVLMVQRHTNSRFMADRFVYPGGKLDLADCTPRAAQRIDGRTPAEIQAAFGALSLRQSA